MKVVRYLILSLFLSGVLSAQQADFNQSKMRYGDDMMFSSARSLGMGGSGMADGGLVTSIQVNPALIGTGKGMIRFSGGMALQKITEDRAYPYYDSFVGFNDYGSYAYNSNGYNRFYGQLALTLPYHFVNRFSVAVGVLPFRDFRYDYREEVHDPVNISDKLLGYNSIRQTGMLHLAPLTIAYEAFDGISFGAQVGLLYGSIDSIMTIKPVGIVPAAVETKEQRRKTLEGAPLVSSLGMHYRYDERLAVGMQVRLPYTLDFNTTLVKDSLTSVSSKQSLTYPLQLGGGLAYRFQNVLEARVSVDLVYDFWSQFKDTRRQTDFNDTYTLRFGVEHLFFDRIPLRAGFTFGTLKESRDFTRTVLTVGSGFMLSGVQVNLAGGVSSFQYYQDDIFPDDLYGYTNRSDSDRVNLNNYFLRIDLNYAWTGSK